MNLRHLPEDYQRFVAEFDGSKRYTLNNRSWILHTANQLDETIDISGRRVPTARSLAAYTAILRKRVGGPGLTDERGGTFDYDRLEAGFCIGTANGDPLFIDLDSEAIYCWHHDGMDVECLAVSFAGFLAKSNEQIRHA